LCPKIKEEKYDVGRFRDGLLAWAMGLFFGWGQGENDLAR